MVCTERSFDYFQIFVHPGEGSSSIKARLIQDGTYQKPEMIAVHHYKVKVG